MSVGVVGAGITGLATVHHCRKRGIEATCFEARDEPGGVIRSLRADGRDGGNGRSSGRVLEAGPQRLRLTDGIEELIDDLDLWSTLVAARDDLPLYIYCDGRLREVPRSLRALVRTDLLSTTGKARLFAEPLTSPGNPDESAAALFARKFGREAYENLIGPVFGGTYGSDPARMPARHALSGLLDIEARKGSLLKPALGRIIFGDSPPPTSFENGLATLPRALYDAHAEAVHLETPVTGIQRVNEGEGGERTDGGGRSDGDGSADESDRNEAGFLVSTPNGEHAVDRVIVTADAPTAASLLDNVGGAAGTEGLRDLGYNPLAVVHLDSDFRGQGFGYQIRWDEGFDTLGVTWNASLFDRENVYTAFLGGMKNPEILDRGDDELGDRATREFEAVVGESARVLSVSRWEQGFPAYDASWDALDSLSVPRGIDLLTNYTARAGVSSRITQAKRFAERLASDRDRKGAPSTRQPSTTR